MNDHHWWKITDLRRATPHTLWRHVEASTDWGCWVWTAYRIAPPKNEYGLWHDPIHGGRMAHRAVWLRLVGAIPEGMVLDHLCGVDWCVNPNHLEVVPMTENLRRGGGRRRFGHRPLPPPPGDDPQLGFDFGASA